MEILTNFGVCESVTYNTVFLTDKYKKLNICTCSNYMIKYFDNPNLFLTIQLDKIFDQNILRLENNINIMSNKLDNIIHVYKNLINTLAWFIPVRKWRDNFRNKFNDKFMGG